MIKLAQLLKEAIISNKVVCDKCGWKWNIEDGGKDTYVCHKCGNDNTPISEGVEPNFDRDMVVGVAEILRMVDDINNRKQIASKMMAKFDKEGVNYDSDEFLQLSNLNPLNGK
jgi:DNA-directed RNA polymerase subunit RPC12/RpoP